MVAKFHGGGPPPLSNNRKKHVGVGYLLLILFGVFGAREDAANLVEDARVGRGVGAWGAADG